MDVKHIFAVRLKALREELGMSQNQLAKELDISRGSISFYENGQRTADIETLEKVAKFFKVDYDYLMGKSASRYNKGDAEQILDSLQLSDKSIENIVCYNKKIPEINVVDEIFSCNILFDFMIFYLSLNGRD